jgi:hypothetical protein
MGLEEFVGLKVGNLDYEESSKSQAQFQVVSQTAITKNNDSILEVSFYTFENTILC